MTVCTAVGGINGRAVESLLESPDCVHHDVERSVLVGFDGSFGGPRDVDEIVNGRRIVLNDVASQVAAYTAKNGMDDFGVIQL